MVEIRERHKVTIRDLFLEAPLNPGRWLAGLEALARATGSLRAQLLGVNANGELAFNFMTQTDSDLHEDFARLKGHHNPHVNYRMAASTGASHGQLMSEADYARARARIGATAYEDLCEKHGLPFGCQLALDDSDGALVGLALLRSRSEGPTKGEHRRLFVDAAPAIRTAVRLYKGIAGHGCELMRGALDAVAVPALLIDGFGRVAAMTPEADHLLTSGTCLGLSRGMLKATAPQHGDELVAALDAVLHGARPEAAVVIRGATGSSLRLKIHALPRAEWDLGFSPRAIVIVEASGSEADQLGSLLQLEFGLTGSESIVAANLAAGMSPARIATERATSLRTVRHQIKSVFAKLYVARRAEFMAIVASRRQRDS